MTLICHDYRNLLSYSLTCTVFLSIKPMPPAAAYIVTWSIIMDGSSKDVTICMLGCLLESALYQGMISSCVESYFKVNARQRECNKM